MKEKTIMKNMRILPFLLLLPISTLFAQSIERHVDPFTKILIGPNINVELIPSDVEKVYLVSDSKLISDLKIVVERGELKIYFNYKNFSFDDNESPAHGKYTLADSPYEHVKVYGKIYFKNLEGIDFRGDEKLFCKTSLKADEFELKVYGSGQVKLAGIEAYEMTLKTYGENDIEILDGEIENMKITSYGENDVQTNHLKGQDIRITSFGESDIDVFAENSLHVKVIGEGHIRYAGDPQVKEFNLGEASVSRIE